MDRNQFIRKSLRLVLLGLLGLITIIVSRRTTAGSDCTACPGKGICSGETDCNTYSNEGNGRKAEKH